MLHSFRGLKSHPLRQTSEIVPEIIRIILDGICLNTLIPVHSSISREVYRGLYKYHNVLLHFFLNVNVIVFSI